jgi:hypothetical protein
MAMTNEERAARAAAGREARAVKREANRAAWRAAPNNGNNRASIERERLKAARLEATPIDDDDHGSASLRQLRALMNDGGTPLYRRLDAAEIVLSYELGPGAAVGSDPDMIAVASYRFLKMVIDDVDTPEALRFRALKCVAQVENRRSELRNNAEALYEKRAMLIGLANSERRSYLVETGQWPPAADTRWLEVSDAIALPSSWVAMQWPPAATSHAYRGHDLVAFRAMLRQVSGGDDDDFWVRYGPMAETASA